MEKWIQRKKPSETSSDVPDNSRFKKEKHWFTSGRETQPPYVKKQGPYCLFCKGEHWEDTCETFDTMDKRKKFFVQGRLCFNCGRHGHRENKCKSRWCIKCKTRHHTSLCDKTNTTVTKERDDEFTPKVGKTYTGYTSQADSESPPPIFQLKYRERHFGYTLILVQGEISYRAMQSRNLASNQEGMKQDTFLTVNGTKNNHYLCITSQSALLMGKQRRNVKLQVLRILIFQQ